MKKKDWIIVAIGSILLGVLLYFVLKKRKAATFLTQSSSSSSVNFESCSWPITSGNTKPCEIVRQLQRAINKYPRTSEPLVEDGIWGPKTIAALHDINKSDIANGPLQEFRFYQEFQFV